MPTIRATRDYRTAAADAIEAHERIVLAYATADAIEADWAGALGEAVEASTAALQGLRISLQMRSGTEDLIASLDIALASGQ